MSQYSLTEKELRTLNIDSSQVSEGKIMGPVGCENCRNSGYRGRIGIFEIVEGRKQVEDRIRSTKVDVQICDTGCRRRPIV